MSLMTRILLVMAMVLSLAWTASAAPADDREQQRARIAAERREANKRFEVARKECDQRFAVTTCLDDARRERRRVLDRLAGEQAVLDDTHRRQRAAERLRGIEEKTRQADERSVAPSPASRLQRMPPASQATRPLPPVHSEPRPAITPQQAERRRLEQAQRVQEAQAHREAVERRNAARDAQKPPAATLPVPTASATKP